MLEYWVLLSGMCIVCGIWGWVGVCWGRVGGEGCGNRILGWECLVVFVLFCDI